VGRNTNLELTKTRCLSTRFRDSPVCGFVMKPVMAISLLSVSLSTKRLVCHLNLISNGKIEEMIFEPYTAEILSDTDEVASVAI